MILCDTNIFIEYYRKNDEVISRMREIEQENIGISSISVGELIVGARNKKELTQIKNDVAHLHTLHVNEIVSDTSLSLMYSYTLSHGLSIPDALIAATALIYDVELYTLNVKDFRFIPKLKLWKKK